MKTGRLLLLAVGIEVLTVLVLVLVVAMVGPGDPEAAAAYAERTGRWLGPLAGFVLCLGGGWIVGRRAEREPVRTGAVLGVLVALVDAGLLAMSGAGFQLLFLVSNVGRVAAGALGGMLAGRSRSASTG